MPCYILLSHFQWNSNQDTGNFLPGSFSLLDISQMLPHCCYLVAEQCSITREITPLLLTSVPFLMEFQPRYWQLPSRFLLSRRYHPGAASLLLPGGRTMLHHSRANPLSTYFCPVSNGIPTKILAASISLVDIIQMLPHCCYLVAEQCSITREITPLLHTSVPFLVEFQPRYWQLPSRLLLSHRYQPGAALLLLPGDRTVLNHSELTPLLLTSVLFLMEFQPRYWQLPSRFLLSRRYHPGAASLLLHGGRTMLHHSRVNPLSTYFCPVSNGIPTKILAASISLVDIIQMLPHCCYLVAEQCSITREITPLLLTSVPFLMEFQPRYWQLPSRFHLSRRYQPGAVSLRLPGGRTLLHHSASHIIRIVGE